MATAPGASASALTYAEAQQRSLRRLLADQLEDLRRSLKVRSAG